MNIYLIGMPLSGKTTIGKILSERLSFDFVDLDAYIEIKSCMFIDEMFIAYGEEFFRKLETNMLKEITEKSKNQVISCGGGIVLNEENKKEMKGLVVYLNVETRNLNSRLQPDDNRPLLKKKTIEELYLERKDKYLKFSDIEINNNNIDESIIQILNKIKDYEKDFNN